MARRPKRTSPARGRIIVYLSAALLALIGLADAVYLTVLHMTGQSAVCGGLAGCSQVLMSKYAEIGSIPVAALGVLGYFTAFSCAIFAAFGYRRAHRFLALVVGVMFGATLWFLYVQAFLLHAFCPYCLTSAAVVFLLAGLVVAVPPAAWLRSSRSHD